MTISRSDLALWTGAEFAEYLTAAGLTAGDGTLTGDFVNAITKALREMGLSSVSDVTSPREAELTDLVELYALERIVRGLAVKVDFTADGASVKLQQQLLAATADYERQKAKCGTLYGAGGATPTAVVRTMDMGILTDEGTEYS